MSKLSPRLQAAGTVGGRLRHSYFEGSEIYSSFSAEGRQTRRLEVETSYGEGDGQGLMRSWTEEGRWHANAALKKLQEMTNCKGILFVELRV